MKATSNRKYRLALFGVSSVLSCATFGALYVNGWKIDGPPMWWVMRGSDVQKIVIRWDTKQIEIDDPAQVHRFHWAVVRSRSFARYRTEFQPDDQEKWTVTLFRRQQKPLQLEMGVEGSKVFYEPTLDVSYYSSLLHDLVREKVN